MNRKITITLYAVLLAAGGNSLAQTAKPPVVGLAQVVDARVTTIEQDTVPAAEAMPEDRYSFAPTGGGFAGVRTFAEQVKHLAAANYQIASAILGEEPPAGTQNEAAPPSVKTKAQILEYLRGSFAFLHRAAATITPENITEPIPGTSGTWERTRLGRLMDALVHSANHYGQMVEYLRMNGIIPPASRNNSVKSGPQFI
jgi:uncharacterized damage-inducible protein DinB